LAHGSDLVQFIGLECIATLFVVMLFASLYHFLRRQEFLRWWTWAWAAYLGYLATGIPILLIGPVWTLPKAILILLSQVFGYMMFPFLLGGLWSLEKRGQALRTRIIDCTLAAIALAIVCFAAANFHKENPALSYAIRTAPRQLVLGGVFLYCGVVLLRRAFRISRKNSLVASLFFLLFGVTQVLYAVSGANGLLSGHYRLPGVLTLVEFLPQISFSLDLGWTLGIVIGMISLLLEEYSNSEQALFDSQRRSIEQFAELDLLYRTAPIGLAFVDGEMRYRRVNDQLAQFNGRPAADHIGKTLADMIPGMALQMESLVRLVLVKGEPVLNREMQGATPARPSEARDWLISYFPLRVASSEVRGVTIVVLDITSRTRAERSLTIQKAYFEQLVESAPEAIAIVDTKNIVQQVNREFTRFFGYAADEAVGKDLDRLIVPQDKQDEGKWLDQEAERGANTSIETVRRRKNGTRLDVSLLVAPVSIEGGQIAVYCIYRDISNRKLAEAEVRQSEERYRRLVELSPDSIFIQHEGKIVFVNSACMKLLGASSAEQLVGKRVFDVIHPSYHEVVKSRMAQALETGQTVPFLEEKYLRLDGKTVDVEVAASTFKFGDGRGAQVIIHDLTERKRAERDLLQAETKFRLLVEQLPAITYMADFGQDGPWHYVSPQIEAILGFTRTEWMADPGFWYSRLHPDDAAKAIEQEETCRTTEQPLAAEYRLKARDGSYRWFTDLGRVVCDSATGARSIQGVMLDITEKRQLEAQLRQSQKMEAIGQLAGGIAHDFNNILMVVRGHTDLLLNNAADKPLENVAQIQKAADRAASLTKQLLAFSRMQILQPEVLDLNAVVTDMGTMLPRLISSNIHLKIELEPSLARVRADAVQIEQVLLNLAVNARDAMPKGGTLTVRTQNTTLEPGNPQRLPVTAAGPYVALVVNDTGGGMDAETQARIFEPFFTTKAKGRGTGLGLATVYGIVKQSEGFIAVESTPGSGTTFTVYLPPVDAPATIQAAPEKSAKPQRGAETILVVDDEMGIRELAAEYLQRCGYTVLAAGDGEEAKDIAQRHSGPIHLLLTDTMMPKMGGHELVRAMTALRPEVKVIYMSGYLEFNASTHIQSGEGAHYLQKPFELSALATKVRTALESN
jgi:two-component system, cell cycle sensor histidine kinase and response regulator CckA